MLLLCYAAPQLFKHTLGVEKQSSLLIFFRSIVIKGLTPEELSKTESLAKACKDLLKSEKEATSETPSFGVSIERQNASVPLYESSKISNQFQLRRVERDVDTVVDVDAVVDVDNLHRTHRRRVHRRYKRLSSKASSGFAEDPESGRSLSLNGSISRDAATKSKKLEPVVRAGASTAKPRLEKPTLIRNITRR